MILWDLDYKTWSKLWKAEKIRPYEMTGDHEFTEMVIRSAKSQRDLFHKFKWETIERRENARKHKSQNNTLDNSDNRSDRHNMGMSKKPSLSVENADGVIWRSINQEGTPQSKVPPKIKRFNKPRGAQ